MSMITKPIVMFSSETELQCFQAVMTRAPWKHELMILFVTVK